MNINFNSTFLPFTLIIMKRSYDCKYEEFEYRIDTSFNYTRSSLRYSQYLSYPSVTKYPTCTDGLIKFLLHKSKQTKINEFFK